MLTGPNFFVVGAPKCGTTSLANWLAEHPAVYVTPWKEPRFFDRDLKARWRVEPEAYARLYDGITPQHLAAGEATVWYLYSHDAVPNIEREAPGARYIALVRNQVDMAYALHEQQTINRSEDILDFATAWEASPERRRGKGPRRLADTRLLDYQSICLLGEQIERLYSVVPRDRVLVVVLDDIKADTRREYLRILEFLGVPDDGRTEFDVHNAAKRVRFRTAQRLISLTMKSERVLRAKLGRPPTNSRFVLAVNRANRVSQPRPPLSPEMRARLEEHFADDLRTLSRVLDRDLSAWHTTGASGRAQPR